MRCANGIAGAGASVWMRRSCRSLYAVTEQAPEVRGGRIVLVPSPKAAPESRRRSGEAAKAGTSLSSKPAASGFAGRDYRTPDVGIEQAVAAVDRDARQPGPARRDQDMDRGRRV